MCMRIVRRFQVRVLSLKNVPCWSLDMNQSTEPPEFLVTCQPDYQVSALALTCKASGFNKVQLLFYLQSRCGVEGLGFIKSKMSVVEIFTSPTMT